MNCSFSNLFNHNQFDIPNHPDSYIESGVYLPYHHTLSSSSPIPMIDVPLRPSGLLRLPNVLDSLNPHYMNHNQIGGTNVNLNIESRMDRSMDRSVDRSMDRLVDRSDTDMQDDTGDGH